VCVLIVEAVVNLRIQVTITKTNHLFHVVVFLFTINFNFEFCRQNVVCCHIKIFYNKTEKPLLLSTDFTK